MRTGRVWGMLALAGLAAAMQPSPVEAAQPGLTAFRSNADLRAFLKRIAARRQAEEALAPPPPPIPAPPPPAPVMSAPGAPSAPVAVAITVTGAKVGITNNQEVGVDEGDIVKTDGSTLVILRRGRLFTVSLAGGRMTPVDAIDAFPPGAEGSGSWYDEMLMAGDRVIVVGYSYRRGGTEINRFRLSPDGHLRFEDAHQLRSNDYYSSRNYASRVIGTKLVFYTPLYLRDGADPLDSLPGVRAWRGRDNDEAKFQPIASGRQVYLPPRFRSDRDAAIDTLHSVTTCDLAAAEFRCSAVAVLGASSRTFYVSANAVYLWISDAWERERRKRASAFVYRLPLDGSRPSAIAARGAPVDQFGFHANPAASTIDVLVRAQGGDDAMWRPEISYGDVALVRIPTGLFGDGSREVPLNRYRVLPNPGEGWNFHNRFVGDHVLYGTGTWEDAKAETTPVYVAAIASDAVTPIRLPHGWDRIEPIGTDAIVIGTGRDQGLNFSTIDLSGAVPSAGDRYVFPKASESENRSHAFFFSPDADSPDGASGMLGLPVGKVDTSPRFYGQQSAGMLFLSREAKRLAPAGEIDARAFANDDACKASCTDWYGNARPIFLGDRTFALLGYELVEARRGGGRVRETARISFSPVPEKR